MRHLFAQPCLCGLQSAQPDPFFFLYCFLIVNYIDAAAVKTLHFMLRWAYFQLLACPK